MMTSHPQKRKTVDWLLSSSSASRRRIFSLLRIRSTATSMPSSESPLPTALPSNPVQQTFLANCPKTTFTSHERESTVESSIDDLEDVGVVGPLYDTLKDDSDSNERRPARANETNFDADTFALAQQRISSPPSHLQEKYGDRAKTVDPQSVGMYIFNDTSGLVEYNPNWRSNNNNTTRRGRRRPRPAVTPLSPRASSFEDAASTHSTSSAYRRAA